MLPNHEGLGDQSAVNSTQKSPLLMNGDSYKFTDTWPEIEPVVKRMFANKSITKDEWQRVFWKVHLTCLWDTSGIVLLQKKLVDMFQLYVYDEREFILANSQSDLSLLKAYLVAWERFKFHYKYAPLPFSSLERLVKKHIESNNNNQNDIDNFLRISMIEMWVKMVFSQFKSQVIAGTMMLIEDERNGIYCDPNLIIGIKDSCLYLCKFMANKISIYCNNFELVYILTTEKFYNFKGQEYYSKHGILAYVKWVDTKIKEEINRATRYLESHSLSKVISACVNILVGKYKDLIADQFPPLLVKKDITYLNLMFSLLDRVENGIEVMTEHFQAYLISCGMENFKVESNNIAQDSEKYIEHLLSQFNAATELISKAFNGDPRFLTARDMAFNQLINDKSMFTLTLHSKSGNESGLGDYVDYSNTNSLPKVSGEVRRLVETSRCAELFANYSDMLLRKTNLSKHLTSEQIETKLKNMLILLKYIQDKDMFMKFYRLHLTRRLILGVSVDADKEEQMVNWLREVGMPADYLNKVSRMFQDLKVSEDFNQQLKETLDDKSICEIFSVKILNSSAWSRNYDKIHVSLPLEIEEIVPKIENYYKNKHNGRNLFWHNQFSTAVVTFNSDNGTYDLEVTCFQASVLFAWNDRPDDAISFEALLLATQLPNVELRRTLWSLMANPKFKVQIIQLAPSETTVKNCKEFTDGTKFKLNTNFVLFGKNGRPMKRGRANLIGRLQLQNEKSREEEAESILNLRRLRTQEAIIQVLKARKSIQFSNLQLELINVLKQMFIPSKSMIKDQLDWLVDQEYITRDADNINLLNYNQ